MEDRIAEWVGISTPADFIQTAIGVIVGVATSGNMGWSSGGFVSRD